MEEQKEVSVNMKPLRIMHFTSSKIAALLGVDRAGKWPGDTVLNYVSEVNSEIRLGRSIKNDVEAKPLTWGKVLEPLPFEQLPLTYRLSSQETVQHPTILYWTGSPEGNKFDEGKTVFEIKCPQTLKSFCRLVDPIYAGLTGMDAMNAIRKDWLDPQGVKRKKHDDGEKYYWQIVSNAILTDSKFGELIIFVPTKGQLKKVKELADDYGHATGNLNAVAFIIWAQEDELPWVAVDGFYKNLNVIRFEIPEEDKQLLTEKVLSAGTMLINTAEKK